jgi:hypothetical protein
VDGLMPFLSSGQERNIAFCNSVFCVLTTSILACLDSQVNVK